MYVCRTSEHLGETDVDAVESEDTHTAAPAVAVPASAATSPASDDEDGEDAVASSQNKVREDDSHDPEIVIEDFDD